MISKNEIIGYLIIFIIIYCILYFDNKLNKQDDDVSLKIPILMTLFSFIIYRCYGNYLLNYCYYLSKQDIIIDMVDF